MKISFESEVHNIYDPVFSSNNSNESRSNSELNSSFGGIN